MTPYSVGGNTISALGADSAQNSFFFNVLLHHSPPPLFFFFFIIHNGTASTVMGNDGSEKGKGSRWRSKNAKMILKKNIKIR